MPVLTRPDVKQEGTSLANNSYVHGIWQRSVQIV